MEVSPDHVSRLADVAHRAATTRDIEADLRRDLEVELVPFARDVVGLPDQSIRAEGTGRAGRFDALFGGVIIEFKRPGLLDALGERAEAARQAIGYLDDETIEARAVAVTDGKTIGLLRGDMAEPEVGEQVTLPFVDEDRLQVPAVNRFAWRSFDEGSARALLELIASQRSVGVTASNLIAFLGPGRSEVLGAIDELARVLDARSASGRTAVLFDQWVQTAGVSYGIDRSDAPWPRAGAKRLLGDALFARLGSGTYAAAMFVLHTYMSVVAKAIAAEVLAVQRGSHSLRPTSWASMPDPELSARFVQLERGDIADQLGAPGLLATDLFDWYAHELASDDRLRSAVRSVLRQLSALAWPEIAMAGRIRVDLLRRLYQAVVPAALRKSLGEFFTPRWLAQQVLGRAVSLYATSIEDAVERPRLLDPSCGSGTFLVAWLGHLLDSLDQEGRGDDAVSIAEAVDRVLGIDINPVSAVMTRVNLLLTLGDRAQRLPEVRFNVFHADSIVLPRIQIAGQIGGGGDLTTIPTAVQDFSVASWLLDRSRMGALRASLEVSIRNHLDRDGFLAMLKAELGPIPAHEEETVLESSASLLDEMRALHAQQRNDVWAGVIEQSLSPMLLGDVDLVVGNPPWVSWKDLPRAWKNRSEPLWRRFGLWQQSTRRGGVPLSDVSTLLLAQSIATYGRTGLVAMLLPQSVLLADPGGGAFRRSHLRPIDAERGVPGAVDVPFRVLAVEDFATVKPFAPDAANLTVALFVRPHEPAKWPAPLNIWHRVNRQRINHEDTWDRVASKIAPTQTALAPVDANDVSSPWGLVPETRSLPLGPRLDNRPYKFGRGFETRGLDGYYTYAVLTPSPAHGLIRIVNDPEAGDNTRGEQPREGVVEPDLFWPLIKGEDVERWRVGNVDRYVFVPYEVNGQKVTPVHVSECQVTYRRLYSYLLPWLARFRARAFYRAKLTDEFPWALSGPIQHLTSTGALVFVRYLAGGGRPAAAVATEGLDPKIGRTTLPYPNNKSNIYYTSSPEEAYFIAAFLNAESAQAALGRFAVSTGVTPAALGRLPLPKFRPNTADHAQLAQYGREAHQAVHDPPELARIERGIDDLVWRIAGHLRSGPA